HRRHHRRGARAHRREHGRARLRRDRDPRDPRSAARARRIRRLPRRGHHGVLDRAGLHEPRGRHRALAHQGAGPALHQLRRLLAARELRGDGAPPQRESTAGDGRLDRSRERGAGERASGGTGRRNRMIRRVVLAGGGTGGHLFPGLAVIEELLRRRSSIEVLYVGTERGIEARVIPARGERLELLDVTPLKGQSKLKLLKSVGLLPRAMGQAAGIVRSFKPDLVIGVGGYASGPMLAAVDALGFESRSKDILVLGGSQGARSLNASVPEALAKAGLAERGVRVVHQTGESMRDEVAARYASLGVDAKVEPFIGDMAGAYQR